MNTILDTEEACKFLKIARVTMYKHVRAGNIPAFKVGHVWRFNKEALEEWTLKQMKKETLRRNKSESMG